MSLSHTWVFMHIVPHSHQILHEDLYIFQIRKVNSLGACWCTWHHLINSFIYSQCTLMIKKVFFPQCYWDISDIKYYQFKAYNFIILYSTCYQYYHFEYMVHGVPLCVYAVRTFQVYSLLSIWHTINYSLSPRFNVAQKLVTGSLDPQTTSPFSRSPSISLHLPLATNQSSVRISSFPIPRLS